MGPAAHGIPCYLSSLLLLKTVVYCLVDRLTIFSSVFLEGSTAIAVCSIVGPNSPSRVSVDVALVFFAFDKGTYTRLKIHPHFDDTAIERIGITWTEFSTLFCISISLCDGFSLAHLLLF